jgi:hypothetical protein
MTIARQRLGKHIEVTLSKIEYSLQGSRSLDTFPQQRIAHNNRETVGGGDLYSVVPVIIKGEHMRTLSDFRSCKKIEKGERDGSESLAVN